MKIGNNGNLVLGPFDESTPCLMIVLMNCQTKLRINHLTAVKSVAILERLVVEDDNLHDVEKDPKLMGISQWKAIVTDRVNWKRISESALPGAYEEDIIMYTCYRMTIIYCVNVYS
ncbi:alpha-2 adrenergic receptor [Trichonephila clavipes]|nr:alpha-2 adrenergic receptor [Trichonephila clavipes]